jgi:hypothetical protein
MLRALASLLALCALADNASAAFYTDTNVTYFTLSSKGAVSGSGTSSSGPYKEWFFYFTNSDPATPVAAGQAPSSVANLNFPLTSYLEIRDPCVFITGSGGQPYKVSVVLQLVDLGSPWTVQSTLVNTTYEPTTSTRYTGSPARGGAHLASTCASQTWGGPRLPLTPSSP